MPELPPVTSTFLPARPGRASLRRSARESVSVIALAPGRFWEGVRPPDLALHAPGGRVGAARIRSPGSCGRAALRTATMSSMTATAREAELLARLRDGDEAAFTALVERHYGTMLAIAQGYVKTRAVAE